MIVVSDSSVIISLWRIQRLELLQQLFGEVVIPFAVASEISVHGKPGSDLLSEASWIKQVSLSDSTFVQRLMTGTPGLDVGESEAIVLALELKADALLIDDRHGRRVAERMGIPIIGVIGILLQAKRAGLLVEIRPVLDDLVEEVGFRLSQKLYWYTLKLAEEDQVS